VTKSRINQILTQPEKILKEYDLCENCLRRLFSKKLGISSNKVVTKLRKKLKKNTPKCYICKNMFSNLQYHINKMLEISTDFQFTTFVTGAILKPSFVDRDDAIRSKFQLKGTDSLKTELTREISKKFHKITNKRIDFQNPDVTFTINFRNDSHEIRSKPISFFGRYIKKSRDLTQKQKPCENCNGQGCVSCNQHGISEFDSVEGKICEYLFQKFGAKQAKISWIGGEDKKSLVLGKGRPFFVKLINPKKRKIKLSKKVNLEQVTISKLKLIDQIPKEPIQFKSKILIQITVDDKVDSAILKNLKSLKNTHVLVHEKPAKEAKKYVYELSYKKTSPNSFSLNLIVDGGLPIKRFVEGNSVKPNISEILDLHCKCKEFDFYGIELL
jgi:tRNA pseudouridine synthase 10